MASHSADGDHAWRNGPPRRRRGSRKLNNWKAAGGTRQLPLPRKLHRIEKESINPDEQFQKQTSKQYKKSSAEVLKP